MNKNTEYNSCFSFLSNYKICAIVSAKYVLSFLLNMCYRFIVFANPINCIQSIHAMACHGMVQPFHAKPMSPWRAPIVIWMLNLKKMLISSSKQCNKMILLAKQENVSNVIHSIHLRDILAYKTKSIFRTTISCFYGNHINSNSTIQLNIVLHSSSTPHRCSSVWLVLLFSNGIIGIVDWEQYCCSIKYNPEIFDFMQEKYKFSFDVNSFFFFIIQLEI